MSKFLSEYAKLGLTNTEACFVLHLLDIGDAPMREYAHRMGISDSAVRAIVRSLESKGLLERVPQLGGPNSIQLKGGIAWLGENSLQPSSG